ncbi:hypothetical protein F5X96DRAFT_663439 [Biscogniauxia mediterranea]|nr:hypothetical protein F5X96DRAFT_663439 [Biscogniauxia mediterranea]
MEPSNTQQSNPEDSINQGIDTWNPDKPASYDMNWIDGPDDPCSWGVSYHWEASDSDRTWNPICFDANAINADAPFMAEDNTAPSDTEKAQLSMPSQHETKANANCLLEISPYMEYMTQHEQGQVLNQDVSENAQPGEDVQQQTNLSANMHANIPLDSLVGDRSAVVIEQFVNPGQSQKNPEYIPNIGYAIPEPVPEPVPYQVPELDTGSVVNHGNNEVSPPAVETTVEGVHPSPSAMPNTVKDVPQGSKSKRPRKTAQSSKQKSGQARPSSRRKRTRNKQSADPTTTPAAARETHRPSTAYTPQLRHGYESLRNYADMAHQDAQGQNIPMNNANMPGPNMTIGFQGHEYTAMRYALPESPTTTQPFPNIQIAGSPPLPFRYPRYAIPGRPDHQRVAEKNHILRAAAAGGSTFAPWDPLWEFFNKMGKPDSGPAPAGSTAEYDPMPPGPGAYAAVQHARQAC